MENLFNFRNFEEKDIKDILEIYNFHIIDGLGNLEEDSISYKDLKILCNEIIKQKLPFIVCEKNLKIIGFSYLNKFRDKSGYRYSFENTVYVHKKYIGLGIGSQLLSELIKISKKDKKIHTIISVITGSSIPSIKIHEKNGFNLIGTIKKAGFKKNQWLDVVYMQKILHTNEKD